MEAKRLTDLLAGIEGVAASDSDVVVSGIAYRSDRVAAGDAFFCIRGFAHDGHDFAHDAVERGAAAVVVETPIPGLDVAQVVVPDSRVALAFAAAAVHNHPSERMLLAGITGTNGKTTTTYLLDSIARAAGHTTGIIGTVETRIAGERATASRTTPESADLHALLAEMVGRGVTACSMEVSSHAVDLHRVDAVKFAAVAFTNLTQDHLDYHHTLEEYYAVKRRLFTDFEAGCHVVNIDDAYGREIAGAIPEALSVGRAADARIRATAERADATGTDFVLEFDGQRQAVRLPLAGAYNVSNALVAAGCALGMGLTFDDVVRGLEAAPQVPGRLERIDCGQPFTVVVDYAHTPDSLEKAAAAVRSVTEGRLITVFGCGGDRDPDKRPMMGKAASEASDIVVVTSDNPRTEDPVGIILQIEDGLRSGPAAYEVQVDRHKAIERALSLAQPGDAVLIAGKGHEDYQIFADRTVHFDDREVAREVLAAC